ncbi:unnamed protein product [Commensalibacter communis]|uniref:Uncharacterized protein n=2 Tax=Commensalibacter communis TaxID=2972786 RepID=A0A9W4X8W7_9PROT|nr:unnamed protein product [Commensalibacter communis]CAI3927890.1 unnamed protein product [Commensalibacter communis]CAI3929394.1 unnamed protein product [Commensalibacter communis]CAI3929413.1 unnamed protein product [Commensalibacter communis]CAI3933106.1 unnamed protein product [Commensalibacter communis]
MDWIFIMTEQLISKEELLQLQEDVKNLKIENQQLSAALLLVEQLISSFVVDLDPKDRTALIHKIDNNFDELGAADTIPISSTPSRSSTALNVAKKLHQLSSIRAMFPQTEDFI